MQHANTRSGIAHKPVQLYSITRVAEFLGCSDMTVYRAIARGEIRTVDISSPGSSRPKTRIRSDDLADYIDSRTSDG